VIGRAISHKKATAIDGNGRKEKATLKSRILKLK